MDLLWIIGGALLLGLLYVVMHAVVAPRIPSSHPVFKTAVAFLHASAVVREQLGEIVKVRELPTAGQMGLGVTRYRLDVRGRLRAGTVEIVLDEEPGSVGERWSVNHARLVAEGAPPPAPGEREGISLT